MNEELSRNEFERINDPVQGKKMAAGIEASEGDGKDPQLLPPKELPDAAIQNDVKPPPLVVENPEVKDKAENQFISPQPDSTL